MMEHQTLSQIVTRTLTGIDQYVQEIQPSCVLVHGDTTTTLAATLAAFHQGIPVGHIEAGLRTGNKTTPFPEEMNRRLVSQMAEWHFAPTERARLNLLNDGIPAGQIVVCGNTIVDALRHMCGQLDRQPPVGLPIARTAKFVSVTAHRRENWGEPLRRICAAIKRFTAIHPDFEFVFPVHPNPVVRNTVNDLLGSMDRVHLLPPVSYDTFLTLLRLAEFVMTDSGGVQEEAVTLGKPVLILREDTERPEVVEAGFGNLVGTDPELIFRKAVERSRSMSPLKANPFGSGDAASKIVDFLEAALDARARCAFI
jgi:UDP-N-acetylglucosamine 2-epimerase (non-hydrolysing)